MQHIKNNKPAARQHIYFKLLLLFSFLILLHHTTYSQPNSFVYIKDGKFMIDSNEYFPLAINYAVDIVKDINGGFYISPHAQYCKWGNCGNEKSGFYCGTNISEWKSKIRNHVDKIAEMGFNSIRLVGLSVKYRPEGAQSLVSDPYHLQNNPEKLMCFEKSKGYKMNRKTINRHIDLFEAFIQIVREHNTEHQDNPLRVILTTGTGGLQDFSWPYTKFLTALGERLKDDPTILAYEPNFEGYYLGFPKYEKNQKYERAENFAQWYYALKKVAPSQLVTYGAQFQDVLNWDAQNFPVDFINLHIYPSMKKPYDSHEFERYKCILKWFSQAYDKPWIIGETGLGGNDVGNKQNPKVTTEEQQKEFAFSSLAYSKYYGAIGYMWWQYKEVPWNSIQHHKAPANFYGLVRQKDDKESHKSATEVFIEFDPSKECYSCFDPDDDVYYNPKGYQFLNIKGRVTTSDGSPVKNVYIYCKSRKTNYYTFSDENGEFKIFSKPNDQIFSLLASYPGMTVVEIGKWKGPQIGPDLNFKIEFLDKSLLPYQPEN